MKVSVEVFTAESVADNECFPVEMEESRLGDFFESIDINYPDYVEVVVIREKIPRTG